MTTTRHLAAVATPVPALSPRDYAARYRRRSSCATADCVLTAEHRGTCLPAPACGTDGAR